MASGGRDWESATSSVRLFRAPWSTNAERVALALAYKGVEVESVWIDYADRTPVLEVSGQPLVPVLDDGGVVVADSVRILRHLEAHGPRRALSPRAGSTGAARPVHRVVRRGLEAGAERDRGRAGRRRSGPGGDRRRVRAHGPRLDLFEDMLDGGDCLLGPFSAADCVAFPFLKFAAGRDPADDELFHRILDEHQSVDGRPRLAAWIERVDARPRA